MTVPNKDTIKEIKAQTIQKIKEIKKGIPMYSGISFEGGQFETGKMTVLRRSLDDIFEHSLEDETLWQWLRLFDANSIRPMKYKGWAPNRPYPLGHPQYDPNNPSKQKHQTDTDFFLYYTIKIDKWNYWANVKMHRDFGEVIYALESKRPIDLIKGHKKM